MEVDTILNPILRRLDVLILLELEKQVGLKAVPLSGKIKRLKELGLSDSEIASVIGKPANYVTATLSQQKKSAQKNKEIKND